MTLTIKYADYGFPNFADAHQSLTNTVEWSGSTQVKIYIAAVRFYDDGSGFEIDIQFSSFTQIGSGSVSATDSSGNILISHVSFASPFYTIPNNFAPICAPYPFGINPTPWFIKNLSLTALDPESQNFSLSGKVIDADGNPLLMTSPPIATLDLVASTPSFGANYSFKLHWHVVETVPSVNPYGSS